jgi:hypothetical protein
MTPDRRGQNLGVPLIEYCTLSTKAGFMTSGLSSFACGARLVIALALAAFLSFLRIEPARNTGDDRVELETEDAEFLLHAQEWNRIRFRDPATGEIPPSAKAGELSLAGRLPRRERSGFLSPAVQPVWTSRGPFDVGGRTRDVEVDVSNEQVLMAASVTGGIWRSTNEGTTWTKVLRPEQLHSVVSLGQDKRPGKTNTWYAGTGEYVGSGHGVGNGIYKSIDGGVTWEILPSTNGRSEFAYVSAVAVDPTNTLQDEVYAATWQGIFRSSNGGGTWTRVLQGQIFHWFEIASNGVLYAGYGNGLWSLPRAALFRSPDGLTWTEITPAGWPQVTAEIRIAAAPSSPTVVHFFTEADGRMHLWKYTYLSGNGSGAGGQWLDRSAELPWWIGTFNGYCIALAVRPDDSQDVYAAGQVLTHFSINAARFVGIGSPSPHPDNHAIAFKPSNPNVMYVATDGGVYRADNGMFQFRPLTTGYVTTQFYSAALNYAAPGNDAIVGGTQDNWNYYGDPGEPARTVLGSTLGSDGAFSAILPDGDHILVGTHQGTVTLRNIRTGQETGVNPYDPNGMILFINPYAVDPTGGYSVYYPTGGHIWRTVDVRSQPFTRIENSSASPYPISAIGVSTASPSHRVYYGYTTGDVVRLDDALGPVPAMTVVTPPASASYVSSISVDPLNGDRVLVTASNYNVPSIFFSSNGGASWSEVGGNLEAAPGFPPEFSGPSVIASAILPRPGGGRVYFAGTSVGLFSTEFLQGASTVWMQEASETIGNMEVNQVAARPSDGFVVVGTHGAGLWSAWYFGTPSDAGDAAWLPKPRLEAAYPSPASSRVTIPFRLETATFARLELFDLAGRRVAVVAEGVFEAGRHDIHWDAGALANGVYLYRLQAGASHATERLILAR